MRARLALFVALAALAAPSLVWAAGKFSILPSLTLYGEWTDNLLLAPEDAADEKISAFSLAFEPGVRFRYDTYRAESFLFLSAAFRHVFEHEEQGGWPENYQGGIGWSYWASPSVRVTLGDEIVYFTDPRTQPFSQGRNLETLRTEAIGNRVFTRVSWMIDRLSTLEGGYAFATNEFSDEQLFDTVEHQFEIQWGRMIDPSFRFFVFYNYNRNLYSHDYDFLRSWWDHDYVMAPFFPTRLDDPADFDTHVPGLGLQYLATPSLSLEMRSGVILPAVWENKVYQLDDLEWYQRAEVSYLYAILRAAVAYTRDYAPAHGLEGAVLSQSVSSRLDERWTSHLETYQEGGYTNYLQPATNIDAWSASTGINYYFFNWLGVGAGYNFTDQRGYTIAGEAAGHTMAHRVVLRVGLTSPRPDWLSF